MRREKKIAGITLVALVVTKLNSFITLIQSDIEAVKNAIIYTYSNGLTEGFNNKTYNVW